MTTADKAAEILRKHAEGWRFQIGWPTAHQPLPTDRKATGVPPGPNEGWRKDAVAKAKKSRSPRAAAP